MGKVLLTPDNFRLGAIVSPTESFYGSFKGQNEVDGKEVEGIITSQIDVSGWVTIQWKGGVSLSYPIGYLYIEEPLTYNGNTIVTWKTAREGMRVRRGRDWHYTDQDFVRGKQVAGVITRIHTKWAEVRWDSGDSNSYEIGDRNGNEKFDLYEGDYPEMIETPIKKTPMGKVTITPDIAAVGMRVHRGRDWDTSHDHQDRIGGSIAGKITGGTIKKLGAKTCSVQWDGNVNGPYWYNIGSGDKYELYFGEPEEGTVSFPKPSTVVFNGRGNFSTWNIEKDSQPLSIGDQLMCINGASHVATGDVVIVESAILSWSDSSGPTIPCRMHNGELQSYYLKRYVPIGSTAIKFNYFFGDEGINPIFCPSASPTAKTPLPLEVIMGAEYMEWRNISHDNNPIRIGDTLVNVSGAGDKGQLWEVKKIPYIDTGNVWMIEVYRKGNSPSTAEVYYLKRFAPYGDLATRMRYTTPHYVREPVISTSSRIEVGDMVECINSSGAYVNRYGVNVGDRFIASGVGIDYFIVENPPWGNKDSIELSCFKIVHKKGTFIPSSNYQTIKTNTDVTDTNTGSGQALKVQRSSCLIAGTSGFSANPVQGKKSKARLG